MATKSLKEKWLSMVQLVKEKGENGIGGSSTITSSMQITSHCSCMQSVKLWFMNAQKVRGEPQSPKNITVGSNSPKGVMNAAFHSSPSFIHTLLQPQRISNLVKWENCHRLLTKSGMRGSGQAFLTMCSFKYRQSCTGQSFLSFFFTKKNGEAWGDFDSQIWCYTWPRQERAQTLKASWRRTKWFLRSPTLRAMPLRWFQGF